jgi:hypothetical protein
MQKDGLHADHIDTTGAYGKRFEVVKDLWESGALIELPEEFRALNGIPVQEIPSHGEHPKFKFTDENGKQHADHVDETGEYRRAWEAQFGPLDNTEKQETPANMEWKSFLQQLIAEEKSKLNI